FTQLYAASRAGQPSPLAEWEVQYADFALWQREWLQGEVLERQLRYWREQLDGLEALELPTDRPRPAQPSHRGAKLPFRLSAELTAELKAVSRREGVTLFMTLLAAFQLVLGRYSGQRQVVVGTDVANRNRLETEGLIGFFINQLVLRTSLEGEMRLREVLRQVREVTLGAYAHQDVPFEKLVEELQPQRDLSRSPLFQVKMLFEDAPQENPAMKGVHVTEFGINSNLAKFDFTLALIASNQHISGVAEYVTDLYERSTVESLLEQIKRVIEALVINPGERVRNISLLNEAEREQLRTQAQRPLATAAAGFCLQQLFEAQVARTPDAIAVIDD